MTDFKKLKKIADTCRKAGIKHFKCPEFEFTLADDTSVHSYVDNKSKSDLNASNSHSTTIETDTLTEEQLMMWSSGESIN